MPYMEQAWRLELLGPKGLLQLGCLTVVQMRLRGQGRWGMEQERGWRHMGSISRPPWHDAVAGVRGGEP